VLASGIEPSTTQCVAVRDWISDTRSVDRLDTDTLSQGYTNLQSLVKCLDRRGIASDTRSEDTLHAAAQSADLLYVQLQIVHSTSASWNDSVTPGSVQLLHQFSLSTFVNGVE